MLFTRRRATSSVRNVPKKAPFRRLLALELLEERLALSTLIPIPARRDHVFDPARNLLYITTSVGVVERFDVATQTLLAPWTVGTSLLGADITPDGSALYVAESQVASAQGFVRKVDLATGNVSNLAYDLAFSEAGAWDVEIGSAGKQVDAFVRTADLWLAKYPDAAAVKPGRML